MKKVSSKAAISETAGNIADLPYEMKLHIIGKLRNFEDPERSRSLNALAATCHGFFSVLKQERLPLIFGKALKIAKLTMEDFASHEAVQIDIEALKKPLPLYGYIYAAAVFAQLSNFASQPTMRNPTYIRNARTCLIEWEKILKQYARLLGYAIEFENEWNRWFNSRLSWGDQIEGTLKVLRQLLAIDYLATYTLDQEEPLLDLVRTSPLTLADQLIFEYKNRKIVYHQATLQHLIDEICMNLPLGAIPLHKYHNMRDMLYHQKCEAYQQLKEQGIVDATTPDPTYQGYTSWTLK